MLTLDKAMKFAFLCITYEKYLREDFHASSLLMFKIALIQRQLWRGFEIIVSVQDLYFLDVYDYNLLTFT